VREEQRQKAAETEAAALLLDCCAVHMFNQVIDWDHWLHLLVNVWLLAGARA
jgi:hypothetical protein